MFIRLKYIGMALMICLLTFCFYFLSGCDKSANQKTSYDIEVEISNNEIIGKECVCFYNFTDNSFNSLKFNIFCNAYRQNSKYQPISINEQNKAYYAGKNYGYFEISKAFQDDKEISFNICGVDCNILEVFLNSEVFPSEFANVKIEYKITLPKVISRSGINSDTINLSCFYPILCGIENGAFYECVYYSIGDPFFSDIANYDVSVTINSEYTVASSGKEQSCSEEKGVKKINYTLCDARSFSLVASKKYKVAKDIYEDTEILYYYYDDNCYEKSLETAKRSLKFFSEKFGKYPYPTYSVCQTKFNEGGMEYPALTYISDELESSAYYEVIIHETAHQWWQTIVGNNEIECGFLDEGLAEYSVILFYENNSDYGFDRKTLIESATKTYKTFCSVYDKLFGNINTTMNRSLKDFSSSYEYVNIAYIKPCIMYDDLRSSVGDDKFYKGLKKYYSDYYLCNANYDSLISSFENAGVKCQSLIESYINGKVII